MSQERDKRVRRLAGLLWLLAACVLCSWWPVACGPQASSEQATETPADAGTQDTATGADTGATDTTGTTDNATTDTSGTPDQSGGTDQSGIDVGGKDETSPVDTGPSDNAPTDNGPADVGGVDVGPGDAGSADQSTPEGGADQPVADKSKTTQDIAAGDVSGQWCGSYRIKGAITVQKGKSLTICAGSLLTFERNAGLTVLGVVKINGTEVDPVRLTASGAQWQGAQVTGELTGSHFVMEKGKICLFGRKDSKIDVTSGQLLKCQKGFRLENGGTFRESLVKGGSSVRLDGGMLTMTDSIIDLEIPKTGPDCTQINGGGMTLSHVRFTGCHCPLHINKTSMAVKITDSIFDGATYPMMIANSKATFRRNHMIKGSAHILDIGGSIDADVANNYWGGKAPTIQTGTASQFKGTKNFSTTKFPTAGPR